MFGSSSVYPTLPNTYKCTSICVLSCRLVSYRVFSGLMVYSRQSLLLLLFLLFLLFHPLPLLLLLWISRLPSCDTLLSSWDHIRLSVLLASLHYILVSLAAGTPTQRWTGAVLVYCTARKCKHCHVVSRYRVCSIYIQQQFLQLARKWDITACNLWQWSQNIVTQKKLLLKNRPLLHFWMQGSSGQARHVRVLAHPQWWAKSMLEFS